MSSRQEYAMQTDMERRYCFTEQEFLILAGSLEIRQLYGFKPEEEVRTDERELYQQFFKMTNKGFLEAAEDGYLVMPEIREMFRYMREADSVITVCAVDDSFPEKCIYPGEKTVLIEPGGLKGKYYKCSYGSLHKIWKQLRESGMLLMQNVADDILYDMIPVCDMLPEDEKLVELTADMNDLRTAEGREQLRKYGIRTIMEKRSASHGYPGRRIMLAERPVYDMIFVQDAGEMKIFHYSEQLLLEMLTEWVRGGETL
ncbi:MAG: hypothetical protein HDR17_06365 [Lachnospiraceae bacterium]|nr:hypothetical protein [Lachnospiraceae bacterium]